MKIGHFTTVLFMLCAVPCAQGQEILTVGGARYRFSGVNNSFIVHPEGTQPDTLTLEESLARCDELVAAILERATPTGRKVAFLRDRTVPLPRSLTWVEYSQRHQGYRIVGAGGRIGLDARGRITFAGLQYESEKFRTFKPRNIAALAATARRAVPRRIIGPPLHADLMIDPMGEAPARLSYYITYPVREQGADGGWQVIMDAVTGKVVSSATSSIQAAAAP